MDYKLPDGTVIDLAEISEISDIKDYGNDSKTIDESTLCFTVRFKSDHSVKVNRNYHFNDWFNVFKELRSIRDDLIQSWEAYKQKQD